MKTKWIITTCLAGAGALFWVNQLSPDARSRGVVEAQESQPGPTRLKSHAFAGPPVGDSATRTPKPGRGARGPAVQSADEAVKTNAIARWQFASGWGHETRPEFREFSAWTERYLTPTAEATTSEGVKLAVRRREALKQVIVSDPEAAIALAVPAGVRSRLPAVVVQQLEERVSGRGDFAVLASTPAEGAPPGSAPAVMRQVRIAERSWRASVFGARENQRTTHNVSLHGIGVDGMMAVSDLPLRLLEPGEVPAAELAVADTRCPVSRQESAESGLAAQSGDRLFRLCSAAHLANLEASVSAEEGLLAEAPYETHGAKRLLLMLVDFPDRPGSPVSASAARSTINSVAQFLQANSFEQLSFATTDITPVMRMPWASGVYSANDDFGSLLQHARAAANAAGYTIDSYQFDIVAFTQIGFGWGGLGYVGWKGAWVQGGLSAGTTAHELGHNLGLWHAGFWNAPDGIGLGGRREEYGNIFDVLGNSGSFPSGHFSANFKYQVGWLAAANLYSGSGPGTFRLHAMDAGGALRADRRYALRIPAAVPVLGLSLDYWIDYRSALRVAGTGTEGATVQWGAAQSARNASLLIDTTPGSGSGKRDATVSVGNSFTDAARNLTLTVVGQGGTGQDAYLDVRIGPPPPPVSLTDALDLPGATWITGGHAGWQGQAGFGHDGMDAARSATIGHGQTSFIETTFQGSGTLTFWWKVSSEQRFDLLKLVIDGVEVESISGEVDWRQRSHTLGAGSHVIRWQFAKDNSVSMGQDRGWLDEVAFSGGPGGTVIHVDARFTGANPDGSLAKPFPSLATGRSALAPCGTLRIRGGNYPGPLLLTQCMRLESYGGKVVLGDTALGSIPAHPVVGLSAPVRGTDGSVRFGFSGEIGRTYYVMTSTNLVSWQPWKSFVAEENSFEFVDPDAATTPTRFFKLVVP